MAAIFWFHHKTMSEPESSTINLIEPEIYKVIQIRFAENESSMTGMCSKCYSSGISLVLDEESFSNATNSTCLIINYSLK